MRPEALTYITLAMVGWLGVGLMVGASGAVLGVVAACAVLFPHFNLIVFVFPVPIRIAAVGLMLVYLVNVLTAYGHGGAGGDAAHLGGMAAGLGYVLLSPTWDRLTLKMRSGSWEKRIEESRRLQIEVDRILAKVHHSGLHSLTRARRQLSNAPRRRSSGATSCRLHETCGTHKTCAFPRLAQGLRSGSIGRGLWGP